MEETGLVFRPFVSPWILLVLAAVVTALSVIGYSRTTRTISRRFKGVLMALRVAAIAVAMVCLLRPSIETARYEMLKRPLLLLVDQSRSMSEINDTPTGVSRLDAVKRLLTDNEARIGSLREVYDVVILGFARGLLGGGRSDDAAAARHSAYGLALEQAFSEVTGGQSDAAVILGDGSHNSGPPDPTDVAAALNELGVPVYTVGVGQGRASADLRDVKVVDVSAPKSAFLFSGFPVRPQILFRGCQGLPVKVRLEVAGQPPQEQTVTAAHPEEVVPLEFEVVPEKVGDHKVTVRAESVPDEILDSNNSYVTYVKVVSGGVRVGFFDAVRPESKFIARALDGAENLSVWRELVLLGQRLPEDRTETDRYDVLILGDLAAAALLPSRLLELKRGVQEEGKGLVALLSQESGGREGWRHTALEDILPVKLRGNTAIASGDRRFRVASGHADHPVLALGATASATLRAWESMPPLAGAVTGLEPKRGATVLAV
ncbi:MAG: VWA domain-containing protein, partial [Planctomycetota bacterium]